MVVHKDKRAATSPHYLVVATVCEPAYDTEHLFVRAEKAFVERKLADPARLEWLGLHRIGVLGREDWRKYHEALERYDKALMDYEDDVEAGTVLPVKFAVRNGAEERDAHIKIQVNVKNGRVDEKKMPPARPKRIDGSGPPLKLTWPKQEGKFLRHKIKIAPHLVAAEFSELDGHDAAMLVNQLLHVHCEPDTQVTYEIQSANVAGETGNVDF